MQEQRKLDGLAERMTHFGLRRAGTFFLLTSVLVSYACQAPRAGACAVPVFRYALEHWPAAPCRVAVYRQGAFTPGQQSLVAALGQSNRIDVETCDLEAPTNALSGAAGELREMWNRMPRRPALPAVALDCWGGRDFEPEAVWVRTLDRAAVDGLAKLPVHSEVARRLLSGDSAVWILLDSPDAVRNAAARKMLAATLHDMEQEMKLPGELDPNDPTYDMSINTNIALKLSFPMLEVPGIGLEADLIRSALRSITTNAVTTAEPVAIPVFGRGLAMDALSGPTLDAEVVRSVCGFLGSSCSCSVKEMRLGVNLFIPIDWDAVVSQSTPLAEVLPPLEVPGAGAAVGAQAAAAGGRNPAAPSGAPVRAGLSHALLALLGVGLLAILAGTLTVLGGRKGGK